MVDNWVKILIGFWLDGLCTSILGFRFPRAHWRRHFGWIASPFRRRKRQIIVKVSCLKNSDQKDTFENSSLHRGLTLPWCLIHLKPRVQIQRRLVSISVAKLMVCPHACTCRAERLNLTLQGIFCSPNQFYPPLPNEFHGRRRSTVIKRLQTWFLLEKISTDYSGRTKASSWLRCPLLRVRQPDSGFSPSFYFGRFVYSSSRIRRDARCELLLHVRFSDGNFRVESTACQLGDSSAVSQFGETSSQRFSRRRWSWVCLVLRCGDCRVYYSRQKVCCEYGSTRVGIRRDVRFDVLVRFTFNFERPVFQHGSFCDSFYFGLVDSV